MKMAEPYSSEYESSEYLCVNSCGAQWLLERESDTLRENGRVDYAIQYISQGEGYYEENGQEYTVGPGSLILYFPKMRQHYYFHRGNKTLLLWTHFSGTACKLLDSLNHGCAAVVRVHQPQEFEQAFHKLQNAHFAKEPYSDRISESQLLLLIAMILQSASRPFLPGPDHEGLNRVRAYMQQHFQEPIDLGMYADMCYVSRNRFLHLFKARFGVSPYRCQLQIRLDRAAEMLVNTPISVSDCAEAVGFQDCSYFCRIFKKHMGKTPYSLKKEQGFAQRP